MATFTEWFSEVREIWEREKLPYLDADDASEAFTLGWTPCAFIDALKLSTETYLKLLKSTDIATLRGKTVRSINWSEGGKFFVFTFTNGQQLKVYGGGAFNHDDKRYTL